MDFIEKAVELGTMLKENQAFGAYKEAESAYLNDLEAQEQTAKYDAKRLEYARRIHAEDLTQEQAQPLIDELNADFEALQQLDSVKSYIEAKNKFDELYKNTISVIEYTITGSNGCDHENCDSCGGGCH